jgi:hypothetical protein
MNNINCEDDELNQSQSWFDKYCEIPVKSWDLSMDSLPEKVQCDAGNFQTYTIGDLKLVTQSKISKNIKPLIFRFRSNPKICENKFDTSAIQIMEYKKGDKILSQVESNFNCLELASECVNPFSPEFIEGIMTDTTQGPSAAGGCVAGMLQRILIHKDNPINLLEKTDLQVKNGKLYASKDNLKTKFDENSIMIGLQKNVRANFLRYSKLEYVDNGPIIDQVYTATCICDSYHKNSLSEKLLKCAYDGTYLSAIECKTTKLFLTLIGGGSFSNNIDSILDAIYNAHISHSPFMLENSVVIVPIYVSNQNLFQKIRDKFSDDFVKFLISN